MKIAIFYNIFQCGIGALVYQQQLHRLYCSGLIDAADHIHFGVNGKEELFNVPERAIVVYNKNCEEETETLMAVKDFCIKNPDHKVLYFHMKGVSKQTLVANSWRLMMEHYVIDKWKDCVNELDSCDSVGINLKVLGPTTWSDGRQSWEKAGTKHYVGNFWWARADYVNTLNESFLTSDFRLDREFWIGTGNGEMKSLYQPEDHEPYTYYYKEEDYL